MTGSINSVDGNVKVEIHKVFKVLLSIILLFPLIGITAMALSKMDDFPFSIILVALGQFLLIRFIFIGLAFRLLSRESLSRLMDVLDVDWIKD